MSCLCREISVFVCVLGSGDLGSPIRNYDMLEVQSCITFPSYPHRNTNKTSAFSLSTVNCVFTTFQHKPESAIHFALSVCRQLWEKGRRKITDGPVACSNMLLLNGLMEAAKLDGKAVPTITIFDVMLCRKFQWFCTKTLPVDPEQIRTGFLLDPMVFCMLTRFHLREHSILWCLSCNQTWLPGNTFVHSYHSLLLEWDAVSRRPWKVNERNMASWQDSYVLLQVLLTEDTGVRWKFYHPLHTTSSCLSTSPYQIVSWALTRALVLTRMPCFTASEAASALLV